MKILFAGILVFVFLAGCRKKSDTCDQNMADIAGKYKMTKFEQVSYSTGMAQDVTSYLTACQVSGIYTLNADSTMIYTETANCTGSGAGRWNIDGGHFYTEFNSGSSYLIHPTVIVSWDCNTLVLMTQYPNANTNDRITLTRL